MQDISQKINQAGKLMISLFDVASLQEEIISPTIKLAIFRIVQEAINNVLKHSQATELRIEISIGDNHRILLILADNGVGFDEKAVKKGTGLSNIRNRVELHQGSMLLTTAPGAGCVLRIEVPCV